MNILKYKGFEGTAEIDMERGVCRGKLLFIDDLVTYVADSPRQLQQEFETAVDDYLDTCKALGRDANKPFRGVFNVRLSPALHRAAAVRAMRDEVTLNEVMVRAVDTYVNARVEVNHSHKVLVTVEPQHSMITMSAEVSGSQKWSVPNVHH